MKDDRAKSPDNRARAEPHIEKVDHSDVSKGTGDTSQGEAAAERGERIETGKQIARGGKSSGNVPGATPQGNEKQRND